MPVEAVIFDLDGTLAHFNLDFKALRGEVRGYLIRVGVPTSVVNVNESIFEMLIKLKYSSKTATNRTPPECLKMFEAEL